MPKTAAAKRTRPAPDPASQRDSALSRWDAEGGAPPEGQQLEPVAVAASATPAAAGSTELAQLRVRVIALENLVMALLAQASDRQLEDAREMAAYISPRPGFTHHPLTLRAASRMIHLVERAGHFRAPAA